MHSELFIAIIMTRHEMILLDITFREERISQIFLGRLSLKAKS